MRAWIFDLDGTLTEPIHDFAGLKRQLGLPPDLQVLAGIAGRPPEQRPALLEAVRAWEVEHLERARAAPGAHALLAFLRGRPVGIVTRNTRESALHTLEKIGLRDCFDERFVIGRDDATPKPSPEGVRALLTAWGEAPEQACMVGDHVDDLRAGRGAGTWAIWVDHAGDGRFSTEADRTVRSLDELIAG